MVELVVVRRGDKGEGIKVWSMLEAGLRRSKRGLDMCIPLQKRAQRLGRNK